MTMLPRNNDTVPIASLVGVAQTALGFGAGLLLAGKMTRTTQKVTVITTFSLGVVLVLSVASAVTVRLVDRPTSARRMRRRLESIREDSGFPDDAEIF